MIKASTKSSNVTSDDNCKFNKTTTIARRIDNIMVDPFPLLLLVHSSPLKNTFVGNLSPAAIFTPGIPFLVSVCFCVSKVLLKKN
jgi:hypothetical protein